MYHCPNCNYSTEVVCNFCPICGGEMTDSVPKPSVSKPKMIIGGIISIIGILEAVAALVMAVIPLFLGKGDIVTEVKEYCYFTGIGYVVYAIAACVVGFLLSNSVLKTGVPVRFSSVARVLCLLGIVIACVTVFVFVINIQDVAQHLQSYFNFDAVAGSYV